jgi:hypothetical protein
MGILTKSTKFLLSIHTFSQLAFKFYTPQSEYSPPERLPPFLYPKENTSLVYPTGHPLASASKPLTIPTLSFPCLNNGNPPLVLRTAKFSGI